MPLRNDTLLQGSDFWCRFIILNPNSLFSRNKTWLLADSVTCNSGLKIAVFPNLRRLMHRAAKGSSFWCRFIILSPRSRFSRNKTWLLSDCISGLKYIHVAWIMTWRWGLVKKSLSPRIFDVRDDSIYGRVFLTFWLLLVTNPIYIWLANADFLHSGSCHCRCHASELKRLPGCWRNYFLRP